MGRNASSPRGLLEALADAQVAATIREDLAWRRARDREETGARSAGFRHAARLAVTIGPLLAYAIQGDIAMMSHSLKVARRNLAKHKAFSAINIAGLAVGLAACLFLVIWVRDELGYDSFHRRADAISRLDLRWNSNPMSETPYPLGPAVATEVPEARAVARQTSLGSVVLRSGETKSFFENRIKAVDPAFLRMFTFPLRQGQADTALAGVHSMILTESMAAKYFGREDPLGRTLTLEGKYDFKVTGILKDIPAASSLQFDALVPLEFMREFGWYIERWDSINVTTWLELGRADQAAAAARKITALFRARTGSSRPEISLTELKTINLYASNNPGQTAPKIQAVYRLGGLAAAILLIACINFMSLSTARAAKRALEVGLRKTVGATRRDLIGQFYGESLLVTGIAFLAAFVLVLAGLPAFNVLAGKALTLRSVLRLDYLLAFAGVALITGLLAGSYPALFLSSFRPARVLKGALRTGPRSGLARKVLIVAQFGLAVTVLVGMFVVLGQLKYLRSRDVGYDKEQLVYVTLPREVQPQYRVLRESFLRETDAAGVAGVFRHPTVISSNFGVEDWEGRSAEQRLKAFYSAVDPHFLETVGVQILRGRGFSEDRAGDFADQGLINQSMARDVPEGTPLNPANGFLINEELARQMGLADPVGRKMTFLNSSGVIIGVMKDFHFQAVQRRIEPLILFVSPDHVRYAVIRLPAGDTRASLAAVRKVWTRLFPSHPFDVRFYDEDFQRMLESERRMGQLLQGASMLAVLIACLGLFGLAAFLAEQRTREIGIRKTLGATSARITVLMSREFLLWVLGGNLIAAPAAYAVMSGWLGGYAYHIRIGAGVFLAALALTLAVAMLTVGRQTLKIARLNPARCLKYE